MSVVKSFKKAAPALPAENALYGVAGCITGFTAEGRALVEYPGCMESMPARSILPDHGKLASASLPVQVFLVFENGDPERPVISGVFNDSPFSPSAAVEEFETEGFTEKAGHVDVDGKRLTFNAKNEILLQCGKSSILLRRDGKIVIKGSNLISRSSQANKIKGSSVSIN